MKRAAGMTAALGMDVLDVVLEFATRDVVSGCAFNNDYLAVLYCLEGFVGLVGVDVMQGT